MDFQQVALVVVRIAGGVTPLVDEGRLLAIEVVGETVAEAFGIGHPEAAAVGVILPRRHIACRIGHARQQAAAGGVGMIRIANHRPGDARRRTGGRDGRQAAIGGVSVGPGAAGEVGHGRDVGPGVGVVSEREPTGGIATIRDPRDPIRARDVADRDAIAKPVARRRDRTEATHRRAEDGGVAVEVLPGETGRGGAREATEDAGRVRESAGAAREHEPHPGIREPGHRARPVDTHFDPVGIRERPALPHATIRPRGRRPDEAGDRVDRVVAPTEGQRHAEIGNLNVGFFVVDAAGGHVDGVSRTEPGVVNGDRGLEIRPRGRNPRRRPAIRHQRVGAHRAVDDVADGLAIESRLRRIARHALERVPDALPLFRGVGATADCNLVFRHEGGELHTCVVRHSRKAVGHGGRDRIADLRTHAGQQRGDVGHVAGVDLHEVGHPAGRGRGDLEGLHRRHAFEVGQFLEREAFERRVGVAQEQVAIEIDRGGAGVDRKPTVDVGRDVDPHVGRQIGKLQAGGRGGRKRGAARGDAEGHVRAVRDRGREGGERSLIGIGRREILRDGEVEQAADGLVTVNRRAIGPVELLGVGDAPLGGQERLRELVGVEPDRDEPIGRAGERARIARAARWSRDGDRKRKLPGGGIGDGGRSGRDRDPVTAEHGPGGALDIELRVDRETAEGDVGEREIDAARAEQRLRAVGEPDGDPILGRRRDRGRPRRLGRLTDHGVGQPRRQHRERLLADRAVVADVGDRELRPVLSQPGGHLRLVVFGCGLLLPDRIREVVGLERAERHAREDARQARPEIAKLPRGVDRHPGLHARRRDRHESLDPSVLEAIGVLVVAEARRGENVCGGKRVAGTDIVAKL